LIKKFLINTSPSNKQSQDLLSYAHTVTHSAYSFQIWTKKSTFTLPAILS